MSQFTIHQTATAPEGSRDVLNGVQQAWGFVPNLHNVLAESPQALEAYAATWALFDKTAFSPVERNIVYLAIISKMNAATAWLAIPACRKWRALRTHTLQPSAMALQSMMPSSKRCASSLKR